MQCPRCQHANPEGAKFWNECATPLPLRDGLLWRVIIEPERQDDRRIVFVASHPEFDGVLGTGLAEEYPIPELPVAPSAAE